MDKIRSILIVDDSPIAKRIIKSSIKKVLDCEMHEANDGLMGVEKFKEIRPDVTFMDLTMPVMDGLQAIEKIREFDEKAIVIVCTADVQSNSIKKVAEAGALTLIKKPPSIEAINQALLQAQEVLERL